MIYLAWAILNRKGPYEVDFKPAIAMAACVWVGAKIVDYTISAETLIRAFVRLTISLFAALIPVIAVHLFAYFFKDLLLVDGNVSIIQQLWVIAYIASMVLTPVILILWLAVIIPLIAVNVLIVILIVAEFVARRVAEYRSPILAISVLIGIVLAIVKAFRRHS